MTLDPYATLGISKAATQEEIREAYRKLAKKYHPDLNPGNKNAEAKFKDINTANELIGSIEARKKFDQGGEQEELLRNARSSRPFYYESQTGGGRYSFAGFDESIFDSIFGDAERTRSAQDQVFAMQVSFKDSVLGAKREITLPNGKHLEVTLPAGIESGQKLRFKGLGESGGDLYIEVHVEPSKQFRRSGSDLETDMDVPLEKAILGGEVQVATVDGKVLLKIPVGVSTGTRLRVKGKGIKKRSGIPGDLYVTIRIEIPSQVDPELQDAIRKWSRSRSRSRAKESA